MKRVLIISPYFPPVNAADMQRVRMSVSYFEEFGWNAEIVVVDPAFSDMNTDPLLKQSVPSTIQVHTVQAFSKKYTSKLGLGSIALRSLYFFKKKVDEILKQKRFDLIYFSTTQFPICILGAYWKKKFELPFVIDMQDPWHSEYYQDKPKNERPPKYWFSYRLNKYLEPIAMKKVDGLISVSQAYLDLLKERYAHIRSIPQKVITFGAFDKDFEIARKNEAQITEPYKLNKTFKNLVYIGRGGYDMHKALSFFFKAFSKGLDEKAELFKLIRFNFIGTSYAAAGQGKKTIQPLADELGIGAYVTEYTDRIPFYSGLNLLLKADALLITGSDDPAYTASKIYPYLLTGKPVFSIFHPSSSAVSILRKCYGTDVATFDQDEQTIIHSIYQKLQKFAEDSLETPVLNETEFSKYTAKFMAKEQCELFDKVMKKAGYQSGTLS